VGAHYGYIALALSALVGPTGRVFAFEPVLATAGQLSRMRVLNHLNHLTVVPLGLSAATELQSIEVSLVRGMADHSLSVHGTAVDRIFAVGLDTVWPSLARGDEKVHGVKIDVQGMELEVLRGMQGILLASRPRLVLELHEGVDREAILMLLAKAGYVGTGEAVWPPMDSDPRELLDNRSYCFAPVGHDCLD